MRNLLFLAILLGTGPLHLVGQAGIPPVDLNHQPRSCSILKAQSAQATHLDDSELLSAYNLQADTIRSLHFIGMVHGEDAGAERITGPQPDLPVVIDFVHPNLLRATVVASFAGSRRFEMASDGKEIRLLMPRAGRTAFFVGPVDAPIQIAGGSFAMNFRFLMDALRWPEGSRIVPQEHPGPETSSRTLKLELSAVGSNAHTAQVDFDLLLGHVDSVATYDSAGELISKTTYSEWQDVGMSPPGPSQGCLPRRVELFLPKQDYRIPLRLSQVVLNADIPRTYFHPSPPRGIPVLRLDSLEGATPR